MNAIVLKFGSSVLTHDDALHTLVLEVYRHVRRGRRVVAVVSAIGPSTDRLLRQARALAHDPPPAALAHLLASAEHAGAAKAVLALDNAGVPALLRTPADIALRTTGPALDARPVSLDRAALACALAQAPVVVVPGFIGLDAGGTTLLGRGGSDLTALFLAQQLAAPCRLIKDVDGWFLGDPAATHTRYARLSWDDARATPAPVVQRHAVDLAARTRTPFRVCSPGSDRGTLVGPGPTRTAVPNPRRPLRVVLLGLGIVGQGVYRHLADDPARFRVAAILVRDPARPRDVPAPDTLLTADPDRALDTPCDVVVELTPGCEPAAQLIERALRAGRHVVSANKAALALAGPRLRRTARAHGVRFLYSAAAGGAVPMLPTLARIAAGPGVESFRATPNGTTNFILDQLAAGAAFHDALNHARALGLAEADPSADLTGLDAAHKLVLLARAAFRVPVALRDVRYEGIGPDAPRRCGARPGDRLRLVASGRRVGRRVDASVRLSALPPDDPLAQTTGERVAVEIRDRAGGTTVLSGRGAGRWPTAAAVMGDLYALRSHALRRTRQEVQP